MTDNTEDWGMYYTALSGCDCTRPREKPNLERQFREGWEAAFGLHLLEGVN